MIPVSSTSPNPHPVVLANPTDPAVGTHSIFAFNQGKYSFSYQHQRDNHERYLCLCACVFTTQDYNRFAKPIQHWVRDCERARGAEASSQSLPEEAKNFKTVATVIDKHVIHLTTGEVHYHLAALSALLTPICDELAANGDRGVLYVPNWEKSNLERAFDRIREEGDSARCAAFFQPTVLRLHFRPPTEPGVRLARLLLPYSVAPILQDQLAAEELAKWLPCDSTSVAAVAKATWLTNQLLADGYGRTMLRYPK
jgi:hypothetical protein